MPPDLAAVPGENLGRQPQSQQLRSNRDKVDPSEARVGHARMNALSGLERKNSFACLPLSGVAPMPIAGGSAEPGI